MKASLDKRIGSSAVARTPPIACLTPLSHRHQDMSYVHVGSSPSLRPLSSAAERRDISAHSTSSSSPSAPVAVPLQFPHEYYDEQGRLMLKNLSFQELEAWVVSIGEQPGRAKQIWRWMYKVNFGYAVDWEDCRAEELQDGFSAAFRAKVRDVATLDGGLRMDELFTAEDGTRKMISTVTVGVAKGSKVESVLIPITREQGGKKRLTLCVSSQVGCQMNCQFCRTGRMGLGQNLSAAQIVEQVAMAKRLLEKEEKGGAERRTLTNIVYMGEGEPLDNCESVLGSIKVVNHHDGLAIGRNKISVSTVGIVPQIERFLDQNVNGARLVVSLHATTDEVRDWIVPVNRRYNLETLTATLRKRFPRGTHDHVLIAYTMLKGVNDTDEDAKRLADLLEGVECKINCIVFNPFDGTIFNPSTQERILSFRSILIQRGYVCTVRDSRGSSELAACGQLGTVEIQKNMELPRMLQPPERFREVLGLPALAASN